MKTAAEKDVEMKVKKAHAAHAKYTAAAQGNDGVVKEYGYPPKGFQKGNSKVSNEDQGTGENN